MRFWKAKEPKSFWTYQRIYGTPCACRVVGEIDRATKTGYYRQKSGFGESFFYYAIDLESGIAYAIVLLGCAETNGWKRIKAEAKRKRKRLQEESRCTLYRDICNQFSSAINETVQLEEMMLKEIKKGRKKHG